MLVNMVDGSFMVHYKQLTDGAIVCNGVVDVV